MLAVDAFSRSSYRVALDLSQREDAVRWRLAVLPNPVIRSIRAMSLFQLGREDEARMILGQVQENMRHPWANQQPGATDYLKAAERLIGAPSEVAPISDR